MVRIWARMRAMARARICCAWVCCCPCCCCWFCCCCCCCSCCPCCCCSCSCSCEPAGGLRMKVGGWVLVVVLRFSMMSAILAVRSAICWRMRVMRAWRWSAGVCCCCCCCWLLAVELSPAELKEPMKEPAGVSAAAAGVDGGVEGGGGCGLVTGGVVVFGGEGEGAFGGEG